MAEAKARQACESVFNVRRIPRVNTYEISTDPSRLQLDAIHAYLTRSYWSPNIPKELVARAIANSVCFGVYAVDGDPAGRAGGVQIGFARVVTDKSSFAYLADVYVLEAHRGQGLSKRLVAAVLAHPDLQGMRRFMLATRDAHGLYEQFGFQPPARPQSLMELRQTPPWIQD